MQGPRSTTHSSVSAGRASFLNILPAAAIALALTGCIRPDSSTATADSAATSPESDFANVVKPLIEHRCMWCHNSSKPSAGLNFEDLATLRDPASGYLVPGEPGESRIYIAVNRGPHHAIAMPFDGWGITTDQNRALREWIAAGAPWPEGTDGQLRKKDHQVDLDDYL